MREEHFRRGGHGRRGQWRGRLERRGRPTTTPEDREEISAWFRGSLVDGWFASEPELDVDDYEILVVGTLAADDLASKSEGREVAESARIETFRADTRDRRIEIASRAEERFGRTVSWGAKVGETTRLFTTASVPFMTRLPMQQRKILDTLVESGVARSRSEALAWCVELVGRNESDWIVRLRSALGAVAQARDEGPGAATG